MKLLKFVVIIILLLFLFKPSHSAQQKYPVSDIPAELIKNAKAVLRHAETVFEIKSDNRAQKTVNYALTILNKSAIEDSYLVEFYDKFSNINNISAVIYDEKGEKVKRIPLDEILDISAISGYSIYEDSRVKYIDPKYRTIPFTVEYSYTINYNGLLGYPAWFPNYGLDISVEENTFKVIVPENNTFRYHAQNITFNPDIQLVKNSKEYRWTVSDLKPIKSEPHSLPFEEYAPLIYTAPSDFKIAGYEGNADSWENFGIFINVLNKDRDYLPDETKSKILDMVKDAENNKEKIEILYNYLQSNTRYVSIQVGIGGWQPFEAETVDRLKYGDCKALTNYMKTVLDVAGIPSIYVLVRAGEDAPRMMKGFPSTQFNHAFLCVPMESDTIWLECTSQYLPCGYIGKFTDDRDVLLISDRGGNVVHTPIYSSDKNRQIHKGTITLDAAGNGMGKMDNSYQGIFYSDLLALFIGDTKDKEKQLYNRIDIPNFELINYNHEQTRDRIPSVQESLEVKLDNYATPIGNRLIIPLNLISKTKPLPFDRDERISDIFIRRGFIEIDTITYLLPGGITIESIPDNKQLISDFGDYRYEVSTNDNSIQYVRYMHLEKGTFNKTRYQDFYNFIEQISVMDELKAVLINNN